MGTVHRTVGALVIAIWHDDAVAPDQAGFIMSNNGPDQRLVLAIKAGEVLAAAMRHHATIMPQMVGEMHQSLKELSLDAMTTLPAANTTRYQPMSSVNDAQDVAAPQVVPKVVLTEKGRSKPRSSASTVRSPPTWAHASRPQGS